MPPEIEVRRMENERRSTKGGHKIHRKDQAQRNRLIKKGIVDSHDMRETKEIGLGGRNGKYIKLNTHSKETCNSNTKNMKPIKLPKGMKIMAARARTK
jgi:hypothetical protein